TAMATTIVPYPLPVRAIDSSPTRMPMTTPTSIRTALLPRSPPTVLSAMTAAIGAKNGEWSCMRLPATIHATVAATAHCSTSHMLSRRRFSTVETFRAAPCPAVWTKRFSTYMPFHQICARRATTYPCGGQHRRHAYGRDCYSLYLVACRPRRSVHASSKTEGPRKHSHRCGGLFRAGRAGAEIPGTACLHARGRVGPHLFTLRGAVE